MVKLFGIAITVFTLLGLAHAEPIRIQCECQSSSFKGNCELGLTRITFDSVAGTAEYSYPGSDPMYFPSRTNVNEYLGAVRDVEFKDDSVVLSNKETWRAPAAPRELIEYFTIDRANGTMLWERINTKSATINARYTCTKRTGRAF